MIGTHMQHVEVELLQNLRMQMACSWQEPDLYASD